MEGGSDLPSPVSVKHHRHILYWHTVDRWLLFETQLTLRLSPFWFCHVPFAPIPDKSTLFWARPHTAHSKSVSRCVSIIPRVTMRWRISGKAERQDSPPAPRKRASHPLTPVNFDAVRSTETLGGASPLMFQHVTPTKYQ